jgi:hypothetical protein
MAASCLSRLQRATLQGDAAEAGQHSDARTPIPGAVPAELGASSLGAREQPACSGRSDRFLPASVAAAAEASEAE